MIGGVILIKDGTVVNSNSTIISDVLIENGKIRAVEREIAPPPGCEVINAKGKYVIPGGIDTNTMLEVESNGLKPKDDFYHGTRAGVAGGTTMVIDLVLPLPGESLLEKFLQRQEKADEKAVCDYALHMGITSWEPQVARDMEKLTNEYGVSSFKTFMEGEFAMDDSKLYEVFKICKKLGVVPIVHAENGSIINEKIKELLNIGIIGPEGNWLSRPSNVEAEASNRACMIAENAESALYVSSIMNESAANVIAHWIETSRLQIYAEITAVALGLTYSTEFCPSKAATYVTTPPISSNRKTPFELMMRLSEGLRWTTGSANCTFDLEEKRKGWTNFTEIPKGVNGLEDRMSIVWNCGVETGILSAQQFVSVTSTNAAKIFGYYPRKGSISVGADADIVVWDSRSERVISSTTHHHKNDYNIFEGLKVSGNAEAVIVKGRLCYRGGELSTIKGWGQFVKSQQPLQPMGKVEQDNQCAKVTESTSSTVIEREFRQSPCQANVNEFSEPISFVEPKSLNFQEKKCAIEAMKKICAKVNIAVANIFRDYDKENSQTVSKADFINIVSKICGISALSNREVDAIVKGYGKHSEESLEYLNFLRACEYLFCRK